jgi:hypothetical protein
LAQMARSGLERDQENSLTSNLLSQHLSMEKNP